MIVRFVPRGYKRNDGWFGDKRTKNIKKTLNFISYIKIIDFEVTKSLLCNFDFFFSKYCFEFILMFSYGAIFP